MFRYLFLKLPNTFTGLEACQIPPLFYNKKRGKIAIEPPNLETVLKAYFQKFITVFVDCSIFNTMLMDKNREKCFKTKLEWRKLFIMTSFLKNDC